MLVVSAGCLLLTQACAQTKGEETPEAVQSAFSKKFPDAKSVKWEKESEQEWEAEFKLNGVGYSANFTSSGEWKETEHEIRSNEIPEVVNATLKSEFSGYEVEDSEITEKPEETEYEFELEKGEVVYEVTISAEGKVVSKKRVEEESEEDDD